MSKGIDTGLDVVYGGPRIEWTEGSQSKAWAKLTAACSTNFDFRNGQDSASNGNIETTIPSFSSGKQDTLDLYQHLEYESLHGLWNSPTNLHTTHLAVPILSTGVPSTMGDIPIPTPAYTRGDYIYDEMKDLPWEDKYAGLY
jgi:hypothetical protein